MVSKVETFPGNDLILASEERRGLLVSSFRMFFILYFHQNFPDQNQTSFCAVFFKCSPLKTVVVIEIFLTMVKRNGVRLSTPVQKRGAMKTNTNIHRNP